MALPLHFKWKSHCLPEEELSVQIGEVNGIHVYDFYVAETHQCLQCTVYIKYKSNIDNATIIMGD